MKGRRPSRSESRPATVRPIGVAGGEDGQGGAGDPRLLADDHGGEQRKDGVAHAEVGPPVGEGRPDGGAVGAVPPGLAHAHHRQHRRTVGRAQGRAAQEDADERRRDEEGHGVHDERHPQAEVAEQPTDDRAEDAAEEERRGVDRRDPRADRRGCEAHDERDGRHGEHHRADAAQAPVDEELPVGVGEGGGAGRDRDDDQAGEVDRPLPEPGDEPSTGRGEEQPEEREGTDDDRAGGRHPHRSSGRTGAAPAGSARTPGR